MFPSVAILEEIRTDFKFPSVAMGGGPRVVVSTAAFHARVRGSFFALGGLKETMFLPHPLVKLRIVECFRDREVACSASDLQCHLTHSTILRRFSWPNLA